MSSTLDPGRATGRVGAVSLILIAMLSFAVQDVAVKAIADQVSLWQLQTLRSAITIMVFVPVGGMLLAGAEVLPRSWRWPLIRAGFMAGAYLFFYASLPFLTLSQAASTFFVGPFLITLLAAVLLGERIGPRRIGAVVVGFAGVLLIVRPGADMQLAAVLPLIAALCYASGIIITRLKCAEHSSFSLTITHNGVYLLIGLVGVVAVDLAPISVATAEEFSFVAGPWQPITAFALGIIALTALMHVAGMLLSVRAYRMEDASRIAPFEYSYLAIMPFFDLAIFGTLPRVETLAGMVLIAGAGAFVAWREGRPVRPRITPTADDSWTAQDGAGK